MHDDENPTEQDGKKESLNREQPTRSWGKVFAPLFWLFEKYPRLSAIMFGVIIPLFVLIFLALICGYFLAELESVTEIEANDLILADKEAVAQYFFLITAIMDVIPGYCFESFFDQSESNKLDGLLNDIVNLGKLGHNGPSLPNSELDFMFDILNDAESYEVEIPGLNNISFHLYSTLSADELLQQDLDNLRNITQLLNVPSIAFVNTTEMLTHVQACGKRFRPVAEMLMQKYKTLSQEIQPLQFSWNRCVNETQVIDKRSRTLASRPEAQSAFYSNTWAENYRDLYDQYISQHNQTYAFRLAIEKASGNYLHSCKPNAAATAWFWFTIMTSVGYGNQAPETAGGHLMVYTLGLLNILAFAAILATAGYVFVFIVDDTFGNICSTEKNPILAAFVWGGSWYVWMAAIAFFAKFWWEETMGIEVSSQDSYWFAYISTTTIGLGDFYPQPEGMYLADVIVFSLLFLMGFVLASGFLANFSACLHGLFPSVECMLNKNMTHRATQSSTTPNIQISAVEEEAAPSLPNVRLDKDDGAMERLKKLETFLAAKEQDVNVSILEQQKELIMELLQFTTVKLEEARSMKSR